MDEFQRKPIEPTLFEEIEKVLIINFRHWSEFEIKHNDNNEQKFIELKNLINEKEIFCFFQKFAERSKTNIQTNETQKFIQHKIIIPIAVDHAVEIIADLYKDQFSYNIKKISRNNFVQPLNENEFEKKFCKIRLIEEFRNIVESDDFQILFNKVSLLPIPKKELNKEKDKEIWDNYVKALKAIVKGKEQIWKIKNFNGPYKKEGKTQIDILIDEDELKKSFELRLNNLFGEKNIDDFGINDKSAFIEFKDYKELGDSETETFQNLAEEYFYELSENSPLHSLVGKLTFKYTNSEDKAGSFEEIKQKLEEFEAKVNIIENGSILFKTETDIKYLQTIIDNDYKDLITVEPSTEIILNINLINKDIINQVSNVIKQEYPQCTLTINNDNTISVYDKQKGYLDVNHVCFSKLSLINCQAIFFLPRNEIQKNIPGLDYDQGKYIYNTQKPISIRIKYEQIKRAFSQVSIKRDPIIYTYSLGKVDNKEKLKEMRMSLYSEKEKIDINIHNSTVTLKPISETNYKELCDKIIKLDENIILQTKDYEPTFTLFFITENIDYRKDILNKIENSLKDKKDKLQIDELDESKRFHFEYSFKTNEERDDFKSELKKIITPYENILVSEFENPLGQTTYEFVKNEQWEQENERETIKGVRSATFNFLTNEERKRLEEEKEKKGDSENFREGIKIGMLLRKEKNKLIFRIDEDFENQIEEKLFDNRTLREGFIKPIFPGEIANINRMLRAMRKAINPNERSGYPANRNLPNFIFDPLYARETIIELDDRMTIIKQNLNEKNLNEKQLQAVTKCVLAQDLALIQGPPGTGKTTVISEIIWQILLENQGDRILVTSQTNLAVDNAIERLSGKKIVRPIRIGKEDKFEDEGKKYSYERIRNWNEQKNNEVDNEHSNNAVNLWIDNIISSVSKDSKYESITSKWKEGLSKKNTEIKDLFTQTYFKNANILAATCSECGSKNFGDIYHTLFGNNGPTSEIVFNTVIMDEASKATPPEMILPLTLGKKVIIIGDHKQLPPMIEENDFVDALKAIGEEKLVENWKREDYKISQFEKLFKNAHDSIVTTLDTQFRMHDQIMQTINQFYTDDLKDGLICGIKDSMDIPDFSNKGSRHHGLNLEPFISEEVHTIWIDVDSPETKVGTSYENEGEIKAIQTIVQCICNATGFKEYFSAMSKEEDKEIGIITFYGPQKNKIENTFYGHLSKTQKRQFDQHKYDNEFGVPLRINTVDKFQGMERNILIVSTVRSNKQISVNDRGQKSTSDNNNLGFAREFQRINVAFSRAKRLLIVVGNQKHFAKHKAEYAEAIRVMNRKINVEQLKNLVK